MQRKLYAAVIAILLAVAVSGVKQAVDVLGLEGNQTQAMGNELVSEDRCVGLDFDQVDGDHRDFGLDNATQRVGEGKVAVREIKVDVDVISLTMRPAVSLKCH